MPKTKRQQYPKQAAGTARKTKRIVFDAELTRADPGDPTSANTMILDVFSPFSRFIAAIIDTEGQEPVICKANIPVDDVTYIAERLTLAEKAIVEQAGTPPAGATQANAGKSYFRVKLKLPKNFAGRTPGEIILEDPNNIAVLEKQKAWLLNNASGKWGAGNKEQADAIGEAIDAYHAGELSGSSSAPTHKTISLYKEGPKYMRETDSGGDNLCYSIEIICDPAMDYPYAVTIINCWAPVIRQSSGATIIDMAKAHNHKRRTMNLTEKEMVIAIKKMEETRREFKARFTDEAWEEVKKYEYHRSVS